MLTGVNLLSLKGTGGAIASINSAGIRERAFLLITLAMTSRHLTAARNLLFHFKITIIIII